jgi:hypothetical protein
MTTPANNFGAVCASPSIPLLGGKAVHLKLLKDAGVSMANITIVFQSHSSSTDWDMT